MWQVTTIEPRGDFDGTRAEFGGIEWVDGIGWLAFGLQADGHAGLWTSSTGASWIAASSPPPPSNAGYRVVDVAAGLVDGCPRLVAVGQLAQLVAVGQLAQRDPGNFWVFGSGSVVLYSDDGLAWSPAVGAPATTTWLSGIAATDEGFVAIGTERSWPAPAGERVDGRVWRSADGEAWTEIAPPELVDSVPLGMDTINGTLIATGFADQVSPPQMAWLSTDAVTWAAHEAVPPQSQGSIFEVAEADDGLVVMVGLGGQGTYASTSSDGRAWTVEFLPDLFADATGVEIRGGNVVATRFFSCGDCQSSSMVIVRDAGSDRWRSVGLSAHLPAELAGAFFAGVAMNDSHTAFLTSDGTTMLTSSPLP
jgi:hypothetical protein